MASSCPICADRKFRVTFDELILAGGDLTSAKKLVEDALEVPAPVSTYRIKAHALQHTGLEPDQIHVSFLKTVRRDPEEIKTERKAKVVRKAVVEAYVDEIASINTDGILEELGISRKPTCLGDVLTIAQELSLGLNLLASAIAMDRLKRYAHDPEGRRYPSVEVKGAEMTASMMSSAFALQQAVSLQTAADTIEKAGLRVIDERGDNQKALPRNSG